MKPKVAILTSLVDYSPGYSLSGIILDQARLLDRYGYEYDLLCLKNFNTREAEELEAKEGLNVRYILPQTELVDYECGQPAIHDSENEKGKKTEGFETQVKIHFEGRGIGDVGYREALKDYDVVIDHDLMFLSWHLPQNAALRQCMDLWPEKNWLHWVHSGPSSAPRDLCYPSRLRYSTGRGTYVYLNETQRAEYALMIDAPSKSVRTVYNPKDIRQVFNFSPETRELIDEYDLLDHQILIVYPYSTPRFVEKGVRQLIRLISQWKAQGIRARLVLVNAHCNSEIDKSKIETIENYVRACGAVLDDDVILTCRFADKTDRKIWKYTVPFQHVRELMLISNMFVFPSVSECCSLIQAEASIMGKYMVLNRDFPAMLEFCTNDTLSYEFSNNDPDRNPVYYECVAAEIWANFSAETSIQNRTRAITQTYNEDWIFKKQFEPLLYLGFADRQSGQSPKLHVESKVKATNPGKPAPVVETKPVPVQVAETVPEPIVIKVLPETLPDIVVAPVTSAPEVHAAAPVAPAPATGEQNFNDPVPGLVCPIYGACSTELKAECYSDAGHCLVLDELAVAGK